MTEEVKHIRMEMKEKANLQDQRIRAIEDKIVALENKPAVDAKRRAEENRSEVRKVVIGTVVGAVVTALILGAIWLIGAMSGYHYYVAQYYAR